MCGILIQQNALSLWLFDNLGVRQTLRAVA